TRLEAALGTPARIYYKDESLSPAGSHKPNTAVAQAYYNKEAGTPRLTTETGAGQWGSALAFACAQFDLECKVYMVRASYEQKPYRRVMMETWGASVVPSPVDDESHPGSLGAAISDAVRDAATRDDSHYSLGSVLNHVLLHQTIIGLEARHQLPLVGEGTPDAVIGSPAPRARCARAAAGRTCAESRCRMCRTTTCAWSPPNRRRARRSPRARSTTTSATW